MKAKIVLDNEGRFYGVAIVCPGCVWPDTGTPCMHTLQTDWMPPGMERTRSARPDLWGFNGDLDRPTFTPSLLWQTSRWDGQQARPHTCHSFVKDGRIQFLGDCTHALAGQTVDLLDINRAVPA